MFSQTHIITTIQLFRYGPGRETQAAFEIFFVLLFIVEILVEAGNSITNCRVNSLAHYLLSIWTYIDLVSNILIVVAIIYWLDSVWITTDGAFQPQHRYDVYDISEYCPDAHWLRFNHTELTKLRSTFRMARMYVNIFLGFQTVHLW